MANVEIYPQDVHGDPIAIDHVHAMVHEGKHFSSSYYEKIGAGSAITLLITAPASGEHHFIAEFDTDGPGIMTFSKNPNATATSSTSITLFNNNENNSNTALMTIVANGTYTSSGTILATYVVGGSSGVGATKVTVGVQGGSRFEWILAPNSVHLLRWVADLASCRTSIRTHCYVED